jgi:hypothetical protein
LVRCHYPGFPNETSRRNCSAALRRAHACLYGHGSRIGQERAQEANRAQLQRQPEPVVRVPALADQLVVSIVQEEEAIQIPRRCPVEAAERGRLRIGEELDARARWLMLEQGFDDPDGVVVRQLVVAGDARVLRS